MECILEEVEAEKKLRLKHTYKRSREKKALNFTINVQKSDSISTLTDSLTPESITTDTDSVTPELTTTNKENENPSSNIPIEAKKRG